MKPERNATNTLIVIPARGGSKRLPRKNVLNFNGKPLIAWTIEQAIDSGVGDKIIVSSDDAEILAIAERYKSSNVVGYRRPEYLGGDSITTAEVILDLIHSQRRLGCSYKKIVLLQATSPLRNITDIKNACASFGKFDCRDMVLSVCKVEHPTAWCGTINEQGIFESNLINSRRSQDYDQEYRPNGAIYISCTENFLINKSMFTEKIIPYEMPIERSFDIDEAVDFKICEFLHSQVIP